MSRPALAATLLALWLGATLALCGAIMWTSYATFAFVAEMQSAPIAALAAALTLLLVAATVAWTALLFARPPRQLIASRATLDGVMRELDAPHAAALAIMAGFAVGACPRLRSALLRALI
jgi:hypothetical protein